MTSTINSAVPAFSASANHLQSQVNGEKKTRNHLAFFNKEFAVGAGLFSDLGNSFRLANAWTEFATGHITESSQKMVNAGGMLKNLTTALEGPRNFDATVQDWSKMRKSGTLGSVVNFFASFAIMSKSFYEGMELLALRFSILPVKILDGIKPLSPAGTFAYATREVVTKQIPDLCENWGTKESTSTLLRMGKCVALVAVGALSLISMFFQPICANWVFPVLLTVSLTCSVSYKFFDHLMLPEHSHKLQDRGIIV
ncbi:MAG: hypothetical protein K2Y01_00585 [Rhabdochlamydiaceae bacterium]|nr:hypothetical protein [Rhabdochlamydiaceae bacterium]